MELEKRRDSITLKSDLKKENAMGCARWNHDDWSDYATDTSRKTTDAVFASRSIAPDAC